jgi:hypothetical protein
MISFQPDKPMLVMFSIIHSWPQSPITKENNPASVKSSYKKSCLLQDTSQTISIERLYQKDLFIDLSSLEKVFEKKDQYARRSEDKFHRGGRN